MLTCPFRETHACILLLHSQKPIHASCTYMQRQPCSGATLLPTIKQLKKANTWNMSQWKCLSDKRWKFSKLIHATKRAWSRSELVCSMEKLKRAWYLFSREWHQDRKDGRKELIVHWHTGPIEQQKEPRYQVTCEMYLASGRRLSYTSSIDHIVVENTWNAAC